MLSLQLTHGKLGCANYFLQKHCATMAVEPKQFTQAAMERLAQNSWPGNARQLENEIKRLVASVRGKTIGEEDLAIPTERPAAEKVAATAVKPSRSLSDAVEEFERRMIQDALRDTAGNKQRAAQLLGLSRQGFLKKLKKLGLPAK